VSLVPIYRLYKFDTGASRFIQVGVSNTRQIVKNYLANYSFRFIFQTGDTNPRSQVPGHGELFYLDIPFILLGIIYIVKGKKLINYLPILILFLAPIPAALTKESPHALRAILSAPSYALIAAMGVFYFAEKCKKYSKLIFAIILAGYLMFFELYYSDFINSYNERTRDAWQHQYKKIFSEQTGGVVSDEYAQPYIFALFYQKYPPGKFREEVKYNPPNDWGFSLVSSFDGFEFKK
jgi:hypothetical protein